MLLCVAVVVCSLLPLVVAVAWCSLRDVCCLLRVVWCCLLLNGV